MPSSSRQLRLRAERERRAAPVERACCPLVRRDGRTRASVSSAAAWRRPPRARDGSAPGVEAPGFVDDLDPWYRRAGVVPLPVREGAGISSRRSRRSRAASRRSVSRKRIGHRRRPESAFRTAPDEPAMAPGSVPSARRCVGPPDARDAGGARSRSARCRSSTASGSSTARSCVNPDDDAAERLTADSRARRAAGRSRCCSSSRRRAGDRAHPARRLARAADVAPGLLCGSGSASTS